MTIRRFRAATAVLLAALMVTASCSTVDGTPEAGPAGDPGTVGGSSEQEGGPPTAELSLDAITLATDSAPQLGEVRIEGLAPEHARGVIAAYEFDDGSWWAAQVLVDADGPYLIAPLFPKDIDAGGSYELTFTDGAETAGSSVPLAVGPLAPAPGAYQEAVTVARQMVGDLAAAMGGEDAPDWDSLAALEVEDTPSHLLGVKFAQLLFSDDVIDDVETLPADERDLLDAIIGAADLPSLTGAETVSALLAILPEQIAEAATEPGDIVIDDDSAGAAPTDSETGPDGAGGAGDGVDDTTEDQPADDEPDGFRSPPTGAFLAQPSGASCIPLNLGGSVSAEKLSELMIDSAVSAAVIDPHGSPAKTMAILEGALLVGSGLEIGATGSATVFGTVGTFAAGLKTIHEARTGIYPSSFTKIEVTIDPDLFGEDHPFEKPGHWTSVKVQATSTGHGFDQAVLDAVTSAGSSLLGGIKEVSKVDTAVDWLGTPGMVGIEETDELAQLAIEEIGKKLIGDELQKRPDTFHSCPETWSADIAGADWTWARPQQGLFTIDNEEQSYHNWKEVGSDVLAIGPLPARFGQRSIYQYLPVRTGELRAVIGEEGTVASSIFYVSSPGDAVDITAHTVNAYDPSLEWSTAAGQWADSGGKVTRSSEQQATKRLVTPKRVEDFGAGGIPIQIESTSRTGMRASGNPPIYAVARVRLAPFLVSPANAQVPTEQKLAYTATDRDGKPVDVTWKATGGTIVKTGVGTATYTAGTKIGAYEVTATRGAGGRDNTVTVPVRVVDDHCIVGVWELDSGPFVDALFAAAGSADLPAGSSLSYGGGIYRVTVDSDGNATDVRDDWTITGDVAGFGSIDIIMNGVETGTWTIDESDDDPNSGMLTVETTGGSVDVQIRSSLGPLPLGSQAVPVENATGTGSYTCSVDTLEILVNADGHQIPATWFRVSGDGSEDGN